MNPEDMPRHLLIERMAYWEVWHAREVKHALVERLSENRLSEGRPDEERPEASLVRPYVQPVEEGKQ